MSHKLTSSLVALAIATFCGLSKADDLSFSGFTHGSQTVTATLSAPNAPPLVRSVSAGGFTTVLNGGPSFESYCIDLYQSIAFGAPAYNEYVLLSGMTHLFTNGNAYADLSRLYATAGLVDNAVEEAAFQIAVWEIAYEATGTPYSVSGGAASFAGGTAASSGSLALANTWLTNLVAGGGPGIGVLESRLHQDVIFASPAPEPSMFLLMAVGLAGMTVAARKKAKAAKA